MTYGNFKVQTMLLCLEAVTLKLAHRISIYVGASLTISARCKGISAPLQAPPSGVSELIYVDRVIITGYHTAVFISARITSPSIDKTARGVVQGSYQPKA